MPVVTFKGHLSFGLSCLRATLRFYRKSRPFHNSSKLKAPESLSKPLQTSKPPCEPHGCGAPQDTAQESSDAERLKAAPGCTRRRAQGCTSCRVRQVDLEMLELMRKHYTDYT